MVSTVYSVSNSIQQDFCSIDITFEFRFCKNDTIQLNISQNLLKSCSFTKNTVNVKNKCSLIITFTGYMRARVINSWLFES